MKKLLLGAVAFTALVAGSAMAADQAPRVYRRPVVVAAPVYSWTGFYIGGNIGYSWSNTGTDVAGTGSTPGFFTGGPGFFGSQQVVFPVVPQSASNVAFADSNTARLNGVIGGGQIGYNFQ